jgi:hypothetical protein
MAFREDGEWVEVSSSNLLRVRWREDDGKGRTTLDITFHKDGVPTTTYRYLNVPRYIYVSLLHAPSHGKFFHKFIRNSYDFVKQ